jgi:RND family efflux transporter MFP subunit
LLSEDSGRRLQRAALGVALVLLLAFSIVHLHRAHDERALARTTATQAAAVPVVDVVLVQDGQASGTLTLPGETAGWLQSTIYSRVSGYVAKWYADIGDQVKAGQLLASIDTPELDAEFAAARAKLRVSESQVKVKQADAAFASSTYARWRDSPKGVVSEQEREDKKAGDASAAAALEAARAEVVLNQADVERLSAFEQFKRVTAPYAGTITERHIDIGNLVTAGSSASATPLYRMAQDNPIRVFVDIPQSAAAQLMKVGVPAQILGGQAGAPVNGTIARTSDAIDPKARTFRAELDIPNADRLLVSGLYVQVRFRLPSTGLQQVPAAALLFTPGGPEVAAVDARDTVRFRPVVIGRDDGDTVELSSGVSDGDRLALNISNQIIDGAKVRVNGAAATANVAMRAP